MLDIYREYVNKDEAFIPDESTAGIYSKFLKSDKKHTQTQYFFMKLL